MANTEPRSDGRRRHLARKGRLSLKKHFFLRDLRVHSFSQVETGLMSETQGDFLGEFLQANFYYFLGEDFAEKDFEGDLDFLHDFVHYELGQCVEQGAGHYGARYFESHLQNVLEEGIFDLVDYFLYNYFDDDAHQALERHLHHHTDPLAQKPLFLGAFGLFSRKILVDDEVDQVWLRRYEVERLLSDFVAVS